MLDTISTVKMSREEWLEERRKSIGGSDAAAVDRVMGPISKGAARMQHGVQRHGDELDTIGETIRLDWREEAIGTA